MEVLDLLVFVVVMVLLVVLVLTLLEHFILTKETLLQEVQHIQFALLVLIGALVADSTVGLTAVDSEDVLLMCQEVD